jgi:SOS response regulatory protein OraA/RecX
MAEKGYGDYAVRASLEGKGLPEDMVEDAVRRVSAELSEEKRISRLAKKHKAKNREKMIRFLAGRGFPYEKILDATSGDD